jgi:hypothetical protein
VDSLSSYRKMLGLYFKIWYGCFWSPNFFPFRNHQLIMQLTQTYCTDWLTDVAVYWFLFLLYIQEVLGINSDIETNSHIWCFSWFSSVPSVELLYIAWNMPCPLLHLSHFIIQKQLTCVVDIAWLIEPRNWQFITNSMIKSVLWAFDRYSTQIFIKCIVITLQNCPLSSQSITGPCP